MTEESISVIRIYDVLLVTMPPDPRDTLVAALQEKVLNAMQKQAVKGLVLDISVCQWWIHFLPG